MKYYSIGEFAKLIGKTEQTLRNWDKKNILAPRHVTESGYRYYSQQQLNHFFGIDSLYRNLSPWTTISNQISCKQNGVG